MVQIALENNEVRLAEVEEQIWGLGLEVPEGIPGAPEGMLLISPDTLPLVLLHDY